MAKIRETAENFLRDRSNDRPLRIYRAVVTVPAHFKNAQKYATKEAARQAGFTDVFLITEPGAGNITFNILSKMFILRIEERNQLFYITFVTLFYVFYARKMLTNEKNWCAAVRLSDFYLLRFISVWTLATQD